MSIFVEAFNLILYQPIFNALILLYNYLPGQDLGVAIIVLTLLIRFLLYPLSRQAIASQKALAEIQPKIKEIQGKYKKEKERQAKAIMELYKKERVNPLSGCLPFLVQIPVMIALYLVFWKGLQTDNMNYLYGFVQKPEELQTIFLGLVNLTQPYWFLAVLAGLLQFWQTKMLTPKTPKRKKGATKGIEFTELFQKQMLYFFPFFTFIILMRFPSAIALYWSATSLFTVGQQYLFLRAKRQHEKKP